MRGAAWKNHLMAAVAAACLAGCSTTPQTVQSDANHITLRWFTYEHGVDDVKRIAESHCRSFGKRPELIEDWTDGDVEIARFDCR